MRYNADKGVDDMEKTATLNIRISPDVKNSAEMILSQLGVPMATAIDMYLKQITLTGGIPFAITLPMASGRVNTDMMSTSQIRDALNEGLSDVDNGRVRPASEAFTRFRERHPDETL
jgi:addiction module RelB/DinJ family antitoxin